MKKILSLVLVAMMALSLAACGKGGGSSASDDIIGTWKLVSIELSGQEMSVSDYADLLGQDMDVSYTFEEGGKFVASAMGQEMEGTWEKGSGSDYNMTIEGDTQTGSLVDGKFRHGMEGMAMIFEK